MGFTLALSRVLVAAGSRCCRGADDTSVTAVAADAAAWVWGLKTKPARQTVGAAAACYCNLTSTLTSYLEPKNSKRKETDLEFLSTALKTLNHHIESYMRFTICVCVVYLGALHAVVDCPSSVTVTGQTHINWSGIRFLKPEKPTYTQLTVLAWWWKETHTEWDREHVCPGGHLPSFCWTLPAEDSKRFTNVLTGHRHGLDFYWCCQWSVCLCPICITTKKLSCSRWGFRHIQPLDKLLVIFRFLGNW